MLVAVDCDRFLIGAGMETVLCGGPVFGTDIHKQNIVFKDAEEIVIVARDVDNSCESINHYYRNYERLVQVGRRDKSI